MANTKSVTETGPKALRGVRNPDLYPSQSLGLSDIELQSIKDNLARSIHANYNAAHGHLGYQALNDQSLYTPQVTPELEYGSSIYDEGLLVDPTQQSIDNQRAENQSVLAKAAAGITKGTILAGTTFIDGTVGLLYGLGQGVSNMFDGDDSTSFAQGLWDNPIVNLMGQINSAAEKGLVNYRTEEEINGPWYSLDNLTSANFIFDTVIKNMGFIVGAALSGGVYTKAIALGAKAIGLAKLGQSSAATIAAGQKAMQAAKATRATKALVGSFFNAHAEALQEAYNASQDFIMTSNRKIDSRAAEQKSLAIQEFVNQGGSVLADGSPNPVSDPSALASLNTKLQQIDQASSAAKQEAVRQSKDVGTMDGQLNIPILWLSNILMFGKMYAGGWKAARNVNKTTTRATKEAMKEAEVAARAGDPSKLNKLNEIVAKAEKTGYQGLSQAEKNMVEEVAPHILGKKMGVTWAAAKGPLREGNEEMMQGAAAQAAHYRYENEVDRIFDAKLNLESTYKVRGLMESIAHGFKSQYGDIDNYEEAFVGAITGLLGSPTFGKGNNSTDQTYLGRSKWIGLSGGAITEVRDYLRDRKNADLVAQHATEALRRETLSDDIKHLIAQTHFNDTMDRAIIHDDEKEYKDARTASIFEMVSHLKRAGRFDLLQRAMQTATEYTDEDIAEIAKSVSKEVSATTPDVSAKIQQRDRVAEQIEILLNSYGEAYREAIATSDYSTVDVIRKMLEKKREELTQFQVEIEEAKPVSVSPYIHKDGSAFTQEEIKQDIDKRVNQFQKIIDTIALAQDQIDEATSETLTNEQLDTLTWYKVMMSDWDERADGITKHWKKLITRLANNPNLVTAMEDIQTVEDLLEEAGFDPSKADVQLRGRFDQLKRLKNYGNMLKQLQEAVDAGGINLAYLLTSTIKPKGSEETVGEIISRQFELALKTDTGTSSDIKEAFLKGLNDLKSIGQGHRKYNELLDEYLASPGKIDQAHQASATKAQARDSKQQLSSTIDGVDWSSPAGTIAKYLRDNASKIQSAGGFEKFIQNLTPEQKKKAREAQKLVMGIDSLDSLIDQAGLEDEHAQILRNIVDDKTDDADTISELAKSVKDTIQEGEVEELIRRSVPEEQPEDLTLRQVEAAEKALFEFIDDNLKKLVDATEEAQRAIDAEQEKVKKPAKQVTEQPEEDEVSRLASKTTEPKAPTEAPREGGVEDDTDETETPDVNPTSATAAKQANKRASRSPQAGQSGHNRRRQISQYYLQGEDRETLPKHYEGHPEDIPAGVDKQAFLKYIKAVHKKLVESGAYTYISGVNPNLRLKEGQEIRFTTDTKLNEEAGVPVILMVVTDEQGHDQIIGSLPTSLDFQAKQRGGTKTIGEVHPEDKALYDALVEELTSPQSTQSNDATGPKVSKITTKVEALRGGHPSFSSQNRSVAEVFGDAPVAITVISKNGRSSQAVNNSLDLANPISGQVYVYVTANTGVQIPLLCFSTPLKDLASNDWYIKQTITAIQKLQYAANIGGVKVEILKWLPFLDNLHINVTQTNGKKQILFGWGRNKDGEIAHSYSIKVQKDGSISVSDALAFIESIARRKITLPSGDKIYPTTNVDYNRLRDREYMDNITRYLKTNITSDSSRTIDDWFTYEPTEIQKGKKKPSTTNPAVTPSGKKASEEVIETATGKATVSSVGTVTVEGDSVLSEAEEEAILAAVPKGVDASDVDRSSGGSVLEGAFGADTSDIGDMPDTSKRRRRRKPKQSIESKNEEEAVALHQEMAESSRLAKEAEMKAKSNEELVDAINSAKRSAETFREKGQLAIAEELESRAARFQQELDSRGKALLVSEVQGETSASRTSIQEDLDKLSSMFPKMAQEGRIVLVRGLIEVVNQNGNPEQAYGLFRNGVLYISDQSPKGTAFHEAFHYITDTLLDSSEKKTMFEEASKMFGNLPQIGLEEKLSEAFREFMNERQNHSVKGRLKNIFQKLKHIVLSIVGRENYLDNLFQSIYRNKMQNRTDNTSQDTFKQELLEYKAEQLKYSNLDQETRDYLKARQFTEENYEKLSVEQKEILLQCM